MSNENPYTPPKAPFETSSLQALFTKMPQQVKIAVGLQWLSIFVSVLVFLITPGAADEDANVGSFISMALGLIVAIYLTIKLYEGKNWARYLVLVFTILSILLILFSSDGAPNTTLLEKMGDLLVVLLDAGTLYLIFKQPGASWFQRE